MAEGTETIILQIKAENSEALNAITKQKEAVEALRGSTKELQQENKQLEKSMKELAKAGKEDTDEYAAMRKQVQANNTTIAANAEAVKAANKVISDNSREIQNNMKIARENTDSIQAMRAQLSRMKNEYYSLSKAQRENENIGGALQKSIKDLNDEISDAEQSIGVFSRNVGNYENAINNALGASSGFLAQIKAMQDEAKATGQSFGTVLVNGIKGVGAAFKALLANPIVAVLAAVVAIVMKLVGAFKQNEEASRAMQVAMAPLKAVFNAIGKAIQAVVGVIAKLVEWAGQAAQAVAKFMERIPLIGDSIKEVNKEVERQIQLEKDRQALQDANRENIMKDAQANAEIEKLKNTIDDQHNKTTQERIAAANEAIRIAKKQGDTNISLAKEELRIAKELAMQDKALSTEEKDRIAELEKAVFDAEQAKFARINELSNMRKGVIDEERAAEQEALKAREEAWKAYQDTVAAGTERIYELTLDLMQEGLDKEKAMRRKQYEEDLADIEGTEEQKNQIRLLLAEQYERDIAELEQRYSKEELDRRIAAEEANLSRLIELNRNNYEELEKLRVEQLEREKQEAIRNAEETGEEVSLIEAEYEQKKQAAITEVRLQAEEDRQARLAEYMEQVKSDLGFGSESENEGTEGDMSESDKLEQQMEQMEAELELQQEYYNRLVEMDDAAKAELFANEEEYQAALQSTADKMQELSAESEKAQKKHTQAIKKEQLSQANEVLAGMSSIAQSMSSIMNDLAGDNKANAEFQKALAVIQIAIDTAIGIANTVAKATEAGWPAMIPIIIGGIATVTANIIAAKNALKPADNMPETPAFATGGLVTGAGTGTSDDIPAMLSNGESVMTARATDMFAPLLSTLNQAGGGVPIAMNDAASAMDGRDYIASMMEQSLAAMPNPVVSVEEINTVQSRVTALETLRNAG